MQFFSSESKKGKDPRNPVAQNIVILMLLTPDIMMQMQEEGESCRFDTIYIGVLCASVH